MKNEQTRDLLDRATEALRKGGVKARARANALLEIDAPPGKRRSFPTHVLPVSTRPALSIAMVSTKLTDRVLVAERITPEMSKELRAAGLNYVDAAGNAYLSAPGLHIFISGIRSPGARSSKAIDRAFRPAGLRLLFALLSARELLNATYREMAEASGTALGSIAPVLESLTRLDYLSELRGTRRFVRINQLVNEWAQSYARLMLDRDVLGTFAAGPRDWWRSATPALGEALWGGDVAAAILTESLVPERLPIYATTLPARTLAKLKLRKEENGPVVVRRRHWHFDHPLQQRHIVPPLLVYAELLANGDARSLDAAREIHEQYIRRSFER